MERAPSGLTCMPVPGLPGSLAAPFTPLLEMTPARYAPKHMHVGSTKQDALLLQCCCTSKMCMPCLTGRTSVDVDNHVDAAEQQQQPLRREHRAAERRHPACEADPAPTTAALPLHTQAAAQLRPDRAGWAAGH